MSNGEVQQWNKIKNNNKIIIFLIEPSELHIKKILRTKKVKHFLENFAQQSVGGRGGKGV